MEKLNIFKNKNLYSFSLGRFNSEKHFFLTSSVKSVYKKPYEALYSAKKLNSLHLKSLEKKAQIEHDSMTFEEASAEEMIFSHYERMVDIIKENAKSTDDDTYLKNLYEETKGIVKELLTIKKDLEEKEKNKIEDIISKLRKVTKENFLKFLKEDIKKQKEEKENELTAPVESIEDEDLGIEDIAIPEISEMPEINSFSFIKNIKTAKIELEDIEINEILNEWGKQACLAINSFHPECLWKVKENKIEIIENKKPIINIFINEDCNIDKIVPCGQLKMDLGIQSVVKKLN
jgi:hypothetical protein